MVARPLGGMASIAGLIAWLDRIEEREAAPVDCIDRACAGMNRPRPERQQRPLHRGARDFIDRAH
jgi:hypothetical protein